MRPFCTGRGRDVRPFCTGRGERCVSVLYGAGERGASYLYRGDGGGAGGRGVFDQPHGVDRRRRHRVALSLALLVLTRRGVNKMPFPPPPPLRDLRRGVYSRDTGRGNSREGGRRVARTVSRGHPQRGGGPLTAARPVRRVGAAAVAPRTHRAAGRCAPVSGGGICVRSVRGGGRCASGLYGAGERCASLRTGGGAGGRVRLVREGRGVST
jgi:hypothetical protein